MKVLYLARHAKSSWDFPEFTDFERPLNKRGKQDAPMMGELLKEKAQLPQLILSSPAKRAISTAKIIAKEINFPIKFIKRNIGIYLAEDIELLRLIRKIPDSIESVMLFGHNPGLTDLTNLLTGGSIENIPTCGICSIKFNIKSWKEVNIKTGDLLFFEYPKKYTRKKAK